VAVDVAGSAAPRVLDSTDVRTLSAVDIKIYQDMVLDISMLSDSSNDNYPTLCDQVVRILTI